LHDVRTQSKDSIPHRMNFPSVYLFWIQLHSQLMAHLSEALFAFKGCLFIAFKPVLLFWHLTCFALCTLFPTVLFSSSYCNKIPQTGWFKQQEFIYHSSGGWEVQDKRCHLAVWWEHFLTCRWLLSWCVLTLWRKRESKARCGFKVIQATQEVEIRSIMAVGQPRQNHEL
jgi:hypothetical protein